MTRTSHRQPLAPHAPLALLTKSARLHHTAARSVLLPVCRCAGTPGFPHRPLFLSPKGMAFGNLTIFLLFLKMPPPCVKNVDLYLSACIMNLSSQKGQPAAQKIYIIQYEFKNRHRVQTPPTSPSPMCYLLALESPIKICTASEVQEGTLRGNMLNYGIFVNSMVSDTNVPCLHSLEIRQICARSSHAPLRLCIFFSRFAEQRALGSESPGLHSST